MLIKRPVATAIATELVYFFCSRACTRAYLIKACKRLTQFNGSANKQLNYAKNKTITLCYIVKRNGFKLKVSKQFLR